MIWREIWTQTKAGEHNALHLHSGEIAQICSVELEKPSWKARERAGRALIKLFSHLSSSELLHKKVIDLLAVEDGSEGEEGGDAAAGKNSIATASVIALTKVMKGGYWTGRESAMEALTELACTLSKSSQGKDTSGSSDGASEMKVATPSDGGKTREQVCENVVNVLLDKLSAKKEAEFFSSLRCIRKVLEAGEDLHFCFPPTSLMLLASATVTAASKLEKIDADIYDDAATAATGGGRASRESNKADTTVSMIGIKSFVGESESAHFDRKREQRTECFLAVSNSYRVIELLALRLLPSFPPTLPPESSSAEVEVKGASAETGGEAYTQAISAFKKSVVTFYNIQSENSNVGAQVIDALAAMVSVPALPASGVSEICNLVVEAARREVSTYVFLRSKGVKSGLRLLQAMKKRGEDGLVSLLSSEILRCYEGPEREQLQAKVQEIAEGKQEEK
uniref:Uncharacterized protein n=1 Tax=Palpitomonas bilix TaxID=652834 RepID=A0A7S3GL97_9EUKA